MPGTREVKVYCVLKTRFLLSRMHEVYHVLGMSPVRQTVNHLKQKTVDWILSHVKKQNVTGHAVLEQKQSNTQDKA